jgi:hypothetical protein
MPDTAVMLKEIIGNGEKFKETPALYVKGAGGCQSTIRHG